MDHKKREVVKVQVVMKIINQTTESHDNVGNEGSCDSERERPVYVCVYIFVRGFLKQIEHNNKRNRREKMCDSVRISACVCARKGVC